MTLSRCETDITCGAENSVQKKEKYGGFVCRCGSRAHTHLDSRYDEWLSLVHSYLHRPFAVVRTHMYAAIRQQSCVIIFLSYLLNLIFFFCFDHSIALSARTHTHKRTHTRAVETMFSEPFLPSIRFNFAATSIRNKMVSFLEISKFGIHLRESVYYLYNYFRTRIWGINKVVFGEFVCVFSQ